MPAGTPPAIVQRLREATADIARDPDFVKILESRYTEPAFEAGDAWFTRLRGQEAGYLRRQFLAFRSGERGAHPDDTYGKQMALMAKTLDPGKELDDVLAWLRAQAQILCLAVTLYWPQMAPNLCKALPV